MDYGDVKKEICLRINDVDFLKRDMAGVVFKSAIIEMLNTNQFTRDEIPGLAQTKTETSLLQPSGTNNFTNFYTTYNVFKVLAIWDRAEGSTRAYKEIGVNYLARAKADSDLFPFSDEEYWFRFNDDIRFLDSNGADSSTPSTSYPAVEYIKNPDFINWDNSTTVDTDFNLTFVYKAIDRAVAKMLDIPMYKQAQQPTQQTVNTQ